MIPLWKIVCCIFVITIHPLSRVVAQTADNADEQVRRPPASVHRCVHATNKVRKAGDGTTANSCMGCRPTKPECSAGCQDLIDNMYLRCDGVCLPNGYFFDPQWSLTGCWEANKRDVKIKVERCGCDAAFSLNGNKFVQVIMALVLTATALYFGNR